jgi:hypothetical protein
MRAVENQDFKTVRVHRQLCGNTESRRPFATRSEFREFCDDLEKQSEEERRRKYLDAVFPFQRDLNTERKVLQTSLLLRLMNQALVLRKPGIANHFRRLISADAGVTIQSLACWSRLMSQALVLERQRKNNRDEQELMMMHAYAEDARKRNENPHNFKILVAREIIPDGPPPARMPR